MDKFKKAGDNLPGFFCFTGQIFEIFPVDPESVRGVLGRIAVDF